MNPVTALELSTASKFVFTQIAKLMIASNLNFQKVNRVKFEISHDIDGGRRPINQLLTTMKENNTQKSLSCAGAKPYTPTIKLSNFLTIQYQPEFQTTRYNQPS